MSDAQWLATLLGAVYLAECVVRVAGGGLVLRRSRGAFRVVRPAVWSDVLGGALVLDDPLPPLDGNARLQPWTLALSPEGIVARTAPPEAERCHVVPWDDADVVADGNEVFVNGVAVARVTSAEAAEHIASSLADIADAPPNARERRIVAALDARLDADAVGARRTQWESAGSRVRIAANVLFAAAAAAVLGIAGVAPLAAVWPWLLVAAVVALVWTLRDFSFAHRRLHPGADARRRRALLALAVSPVGAIRAASVAGRDVHAAWDPLAVAFVHCDADEFRRFAQRTLSELRHPPPSSGESADVPRARCEEWLRSRMADSVERFLASKGIDPASLLAPPARSSASIRAWCPRCRTQYEIPSGSCADCGGVTLVVFDEAPAAP